jgi:hypothetical protein
MNYCAQTRELVYGDQSSIYIYVIQKNVVRVLNSYKQGNSAQF